MVPEELALPCPFIIAGVDRPLDTVLSISIRVLLILRVGGIERQERRGSVRERQNTSP